MIKHDKIAALVVLAAMKEIGTKESPAYSNKIKYNDWFYSRKGAVAYWCATFVSYILTLVLGTDIREDNCPEWMNWYKKNKIFHSASEDCQAGDLVFMAFSAEAIKAGVPEHIGIATGKKLKDGSTPTIEGNTSKDGNQSQSNGGEVCPKVRQKAFVLGYGRPNYESLFKGNRK